MKRNIYILLLLVLATAWVGLSSKVAIAENEIKLELISEPLVCSSVELRVTAPGATECHVQWYDKEGNELSPYTCPLEDGIGTFSSWVEEITTETIVASVEINGQTYSDSIVVNYYTTGALSCAPEILTDAPVVYGQPYTVTWQPVPEAERYVAYLQYGDNWWRVHSTEPSAIFGETATIYLGSHDEYSIRVIAVCTGMASVTAEKTVQGSGGPDSRVTLNISNPNAGACEWITFTVNAPGAEQVALVLAREEYIEDGETYEGSWLWYGEAWAEVYAKACYDGQWVAFTDRRIVTITSQGKVETPEITWPKQLNVGSELQIMVGSVDHIGDEVGVIIFDANGDRIEETWGQGPGLYPFNEWLFEPGEYTFEVRTYGEPGWEANFFYGSFTVVGQRPPAPILTSDKTEYSYGEPITLHFSAAGATKFNFIDRIYNKESNEYLYSHAEVEIDAVNGEAYYSVRIGRGNVIMSIQARALVDGVWSSICEPFDIEIGASLGKLSAPVITMPEQIASGDMLNVNCIAPEQAEQFFLIFNDSNNNSVLSVIEGIGEHELQPNLLEGLYNVQIWAQAEGWESSSYVYKTLTVTAAKCGENATWSLSEDGILTICGTGVMFDYSEDNPAPWDAQWIEKVIVENGITHVGKYAFNNLIYLNFVSLPDSLSSIGDSAFGQSSVLNTITLPASITDIGSDAFIALQTAFCYSDSYAYSWARENNMNVFTLDKNILTLPADTMTIEDEAFSDLSVPVIVEIPDGVTDIAPDAFNGSTVAFRCAADSIAAEYAEAYNIPTVPN